MLMRKILILLLLLGVGTGLTFASEGAEKKEEETKLAATEESASQETAESTSNIRGAVLLSGAANDTSGYLGRAAEYRVVKDGQAVLGGVFWGNSGNIHYDFLADFNGDVDDGKYGAKLDFNRHVKIDLRYTRMPHRLDHDPMTNLDAGIANFIVRHTDTDPNAVYNMGRNELNFRTEIVPNWEHIRFLLAYRHDSREGTRQIISGSKCANCHQVSKTRDMDRRTRDFTAGAKLTFDKVTFDYTYLNRDFVENAAAPTLLLDQALHPASLADVFTNRVQFDADAGPLPIDAVPSSKKESHIAKAQVTLPQSASLQGKYVHSSITNRSVQLNLKQDTYVGRFVMPVGRLAVIKADVRHMNIDNDSVFVEVLEPVANAGPLAGKTFTQAYPQFGEASFTRESALSRSPTDFSVDFTVRPKKRTTLRIGYEYEKVSRDYFEVDKTTSNKVLFAVRSRPNKEVRLRGRVASEWINDPFTYLHAAIPDVVQPGPSPGATPFFGLQYFEMYDARLANLSNQPTRDSLAEGSITWSPSPKASVSAQYRWRGASNDDLNYSEWDKSVHVPGVDFWYAPSPKWNVAAGYNYRKEKTKTLFSILDFAG
jgi:hypothetical protein